MNALAAGAVLTLLVAGYPLYELVTAGTLDATSALLRGGVVAAVCAAGITALVRVALGYEAETHAARERKLNALFSTMEGAVAEGSLTEEIAAAGDATTPSVTAPPAAAPPSPASGAPAGRRAAEPSDS